MLQFITLNTTYQMSDYVPMLFVNSLSIIYDPQKLKR